MKKAATTKEEWAGWLAHLPGGTHEVTIRVSELSAVLQEANRKIKERRPRESVVDTLWSRLEGECCGCGARYDGELLLNASAAQSAGGVAVLQGTDKARLIEAFRGGNCMHCGTRELRLVYHGERPVIVESPPEREPELEPWQRGRQELLAEFIRIEIEAAETKTQRREPGQEQMLESKALSVGFTIFFFVVFGMVLYVVFNS